jgi:hypothetical protein
MNTLRSGRPAADDNAAGTTRRKPKGGRDERADAAAQALVTALGRFLASGWH